MTAPTRLAGLTDFHDLQLTKDTTRLTEAAPATGRSAGGSLLYSLQAAGEGAAVAGDPQRNQGGKARMWKAGQLDRGGEGGAKVEGATKAAYLAPLAIPP